MSETNELYRYSVITEKNPREILLLKGKGCAWRRCRFCDYHKDFSLDQEKNYELNHELLKLITGEYHCLEIINSGSFVDLDSNTIAEIRAICVEKSIHQVHFECHWLHKEDIAAFKKYFKDAGITVKIKIGVETFDYLFRESYLIKGIDVTEPAAIAAYCDEVCLLQGIPGQTVESMIEDIEIGLANFDRVCVNIMVENSTSIKPDPRVRDRFIKEVYPLYINNPRVDILISNTDFGVGGKKDDESK